LKLRFQEFPSGPFSSIELTPDEIAAKQSAADWLGSRRVEADIARQFFQAGQGSVSSRLPADRDLYPPA